MKAVLLTFLTLFAAPGFANDNKCSLAEVPPEEVKAKLLAAIADEIGAPQDSELSVELSEPKLLSPLGLGADCSGLSAFHHSAGFTATYGDRKYEGSAVLLGYWYTNPAIARAHRVDR